MKFCNMKIDESFDETIDYTKEWRFDDDYKAEFSLQPEFDILVRVSLQEKKGVLTVNFVTSGDDKALNRGRKTFKIFSTISKIVMDHVREHDIKFIETLAASEKRADVFEKMFKRFGNDWETNRRGLRIWTTRINL